MQKFLDEDFLLDTPTARNLYHNYAKKMPILDYHNHLSAKEIYEDKTMSGITYAWLGFDHYKWRALRWNGVKEDYITGTATEWEKFQKWSETVPYLFGNPLYHWTHLELQRYFDITDPLNGENSEMIYQKCNECLASEEYTVRKIIEKSSVYALVTTDDPCDDLYYHKALKQDGFTVRVLPAFRPDAAIHIEKPDFVLYMKKLGDTVGFKITHYEGLIQALQMRIEYFYENGARLADHGLDQMLYLDSTEFELEEIFQKAYSQNPLTIEEISKFQGGIQKALAREYYKYNWVMQLHIGPLRDTSSKMLASTGNNAGCDSVHDTSIAIPLATFMDRLDKEKFLPKTVLYNLNPKDNATLAIIAGSFQDGSIPGKIQFGPAWWFNDTQEGMRTQLKCLSSLGLLSRFIGMLTDSRSFLSFPRHEYFRRILCSEIGHAVENGEYPFDLNFLGKMVEDICFNNARSYCNI